MSKLAKYTLALFSMFLFFSCKIEEKGAISVDPKEVTIEQAGSQFSVKVSSETEFTVTIPAEFQWITKDEANTSGSNVSFNVAESYLARTGKVIFSNALATDTLYVHQSGSTSEAAEAFLKEETPGFYINGKQSFVYRDYQTQYAIKVNSKTDKRTFTLTENANPKYLVVNNLPEDIEVSKYLSLQILQNISTEMSAKVQATFFVEKIKDGKVWLYNHSKNHGIIILINE